MSKPELLAPAGNLEKLKTAFAFGADAVYAGINQFGLRKYSQNLSLNELEYAVELANIKKKKVYLTFNSFAHDSDLEQIKDLWFELSRIKPHALIIADMGVLKLAKKYTDIPIHISTQASTLNLSSCRFWEKEGVKRIILAREVCLKDCRKIKEHLKLEIEIFIHGAMCIGYSGKCILSNYTSERDANRGGCIQNCRHKFDIFDLNTKQKKYQANIMNIKDLMGIALLPEILKTGIDSLKIEGRMKSNMYIANTVSIYRKALDEAYKLYCSKNISNFNPSKYEKELKKVSNRTFHFGNLLLRPKKCPILFDFIGYHKEIQLLGTVKKAINNKFLLIEVKNPFRITDELKIFSQKGLNIKFSPNKIYSMNSKTITKTKPNSLVKLPWLEGINPCDILYKDTNH